MGGEVRDREGGAACRALDARRGHLTVACPCITRCPTVAAVSSQAVAPVRGAVWRDGRRSGKADTHECLVTACGGGGGILSSRQLGFQSQDLTPQVGVGAGRVSLLCLHVLNGDAAHKQ